MASSERISTLTVRGKDEGLDKLASKLQTVSGAAHQADAAVGGFATTSDTSARKFGNVERKLAGLQNKLAGAPGAFRDFERGMGVANRALDAGKLDLQEYGRTITELQTKLQKTIAPRLSLNVDQSGLASALAGQEKLSAAQRRSVQDLAAAGEAAQRSAQEQAKANEVVAAQVARIRAEIEPYAVAQEKLNAELREYAALASEGHLNTTQLEKATAAANQRFSETSKHLGVANDNIGLAGHQVTNLRSQIIDIGTSLSGGASPFQVLSQQGGQVFDLRSSGGGTGQRARPY